MTVEIRFVEISFVAAVSCINVIYNNVLVFRIIAFLGNVFRITMFGF